MRTHRVFIRNGRPCIMAVEGPGEPDARIDFDIAKPKNIRVDTDMVSDDGSFWTLNYGEWDTAHFFRPGYGMRQGGEDLVVTAAIDGEEPSPWFRLRWKDGGVTVVEEPGVSDRVAAIYDEPGTAESGIRWFFHVTKGDVAEAAASPDTVAATENLVRFTFLVGTDTDLDTVDVGDGTISCTSLSRKSLTVLLCGILLGYQLRD